MVSRAPRCFIISFLHQLFKTQESIVGPIQRNIMTSSSTIELPLKAQSLPIHLCVFFPSKQLYNTYFKGTFRRDDTSNLRQTSSEKEEIRNSVVHFLGQEMLEFWPRLGKGIFARLDEIASHSATSFH